VFELVKATFDAVALFVEFPVVCALVFAVAFRRDHHRRAQALSLCHEDVGIVPLVGDDGFGLRRVQQIRGGRVFADLAGGDAELEWQTVFIGQEMDLGAQTTSGTPQSRVFGAPFLRPVAAC